MIKVDEENGIIKVYMKGEKADIMAQTACIITNCVSQIQEAEDEKAAIDAYWRIVYSTAIFLKEAHGIDVTEDEDGEEEPHTSNPADALNSLIAQALGHIDYDDGTIDDLPKF